MGTGDRYKLFTICIFSGYCKKINMFWLSIVIVHKSATLCCVRLISIVIKVNDHTGKFIFRNYYGDKILKKRNTYLLSSLP